MSKCIVLVGAPFAQGAFLASARRCAFSVVSAMPANASRSTSESSADASIRFTSAQDLIDEIRRRHARAVVACSEDVFDITAQAAAETGLPGPGSAACGKLANKLALRQALSEANIDGPKYCVGETYADATAKLRALGHPVVVKPIDGSGSKGIRILEYEEDLPLLFSQAKVGGAGGKVLLEEYISGDQYYVDGLVSNGRFHLTAISARELSEPPMLFDIGVSMPSELGTDQAAALIDIVERSVAALEIDTAAVQFNGVLTAKRASMLGVTCCPLKNPATSPLFSLSYHVDYADLILRTSLGEGVFINMPCLQASAMYWLSSSSGVVREVQGVEKAKAAPNVVEVIVNAAVGDVLGHNVDSASRDRIGFVTAVGDDATSAVATAKEACAQCTVITRPTR